MIQLAMTLSPRPVVVPDEQTQAGKLLRHFKAGGSLTVAEALSLYGVYALSQRVGELKRAGWPILSEQYKTPSGARVARYRMASAA